MCSSSGIRVKGRFIGIRGMDPNLNTTTINGLLVPSPESGARSVALDVIPADLLEGLEITKTFTPDMDLSPPSAATSTFGRLSAYDRGDRSLSLTAEGSYNELVEETSPKLAGTWTNLFDVGGGSRNLGVAAAISWFDQGFRQRQYRDGRRLAQRPRDHRRSGPSKVPRRSSSAATPSIASGLARRSISTTTRIGASTTGATSTPTSATRSSGPGMNTSSTTAKRFPAPTGARPVARTPAVEPRIDEGPSRGADHHLQPHRR